MKSILSLHARLMAFGPCCGTCRFWTEEHVCSKPSCTVMGDPIKNHWYGKQTSAKLRDMVIFCHEPVEFEGHELELRAACLKFFTWGMTQANSLANSDVLDDIVHEDSEVRIHGFFEDHWDDRHDAWGIPNDPFISLTEPLKGTPTPKDRVDRLCPQCARRWWHDADLKRVNDDTCPECLHEMMGMGNEK